MTDQPPDIALACEARIAEDTLLIRLQLTNSSAEALYVYDGGGPHFAPHIVCDGGSSEVHVLVGVPPLPPFPAYWKYHPRTTKLSPGQSAERRISLAIPLREVGAYYKNDYEPTDTVQAGVLVLRVDVLRESEARPGEPEPRGAIESILCRAPLPRPVALLRRGDVFDRI